MKNIFEVIKQKELQIQQLQKDLDVLRHAGRLLADETETEASARKIASAVASDVAPLSRTSFPAAVPAMTADAGYSAAAMETSRKQFP